MPERANVLRSSREVMDSCLRFGEVMGQEEDTDKTARITMASVGLAVSIINHIVVQSRGR